MDQDRTDVYYMVYDRVMYHNKKTVKIVAEDTITRGRKYVFEEEKEGELLIKDPTRGLDTKDGWLLNEDHLSDNDKFFWERAMNSNFHNGGFSHLTGDIVIYYTWWMTTEQFHFYNEKNKEKTSITIFFYDQNTQKVYRTKIYRKDIGFIRNFLEPRPKDDDPLEDFTQHKREVFLEKKGVLKLLSAREQQEVLMHNTKSIDGHFSIREDLRDIADKYLEFSVF